MFDLLNNIFRERHQRLRDEEQQQPEIHFAILETTALRQLRSATCARKHHPSLYIAVYFHVHIIYLSLLSIQ